MRSTTPQQLKRFLLEIAKLSEDTKNCLARFLNEIDQNRLGNIGRCYWRAHHDQLLEALPAINVLCSSIQTETPTHAVCWTPCEFYMPYSPELYLLWGELAKKESK
jgi:hypothetical protein